MILVTPAHKYFSVISFRGQLVVSSNYSAAAQPWGTRCSLPEESIYLILKVSWVQRSSVKGCVFRSLTPEEKGIVRIDSQRWSWIWIRRRVEELLSFVLLVGPILTNFTNFSANPLETSKTPSENQILLRFWSFFYAFYNVVCFDLPPSQWFCFHDDCDVIYLICEDGGVWLGIIIRSE